MTSTRPPADLERKAAPALLDPPPARTASPPEPGTGVTSVDEDTGIVTAIVAVTGIRDEVNDILVSGCFGQTLKSITPRMVLGHDWNRVVGRTISALELLPGDPRLPRTAPDGTPWPREAGALLVKAQFLLGTADGRTAYEVAKAFGPEQNFSIGYKVKKARQQGGIRHIYDLDVYEFSPVLHGANRLATLQSVKSAEPVREYKATTGAARAVAQRTARDRPGLPRVEPCSVCRRPAAALVGGGLGANESLICFECVDAMLDALDQRLVTISPEELDEAAELTTEQEFERALTDEMLWELQGDGSLTPGTEHPTRGRAWGRDTRRAWGQP